MAEKIVGFRLKLEGEKATIDALNTVQESLNKSGKALDNINKKSAELDKATAKIKDLAKALSELDATGATATNKTTTATRKLKEEIAETKVTQQSLMKELAQLSDKASPQYQKLIEQIAKMKLEQKELNLEIKKQVKEFEGVKNAVGSYRELDTQLGKLRNTYKELSAVEREGTKGKAIQESIRDLDTELKKLDARMGQYQRNVGNYISAFSRINTISQQVAGIFGIATGLDEVIRNNAQLSDSVGDVRRVAKLTDEQVKELYNTLRSLDSRTALTSLLDISTIGGKLGVSAKDLAGFTAAADKLQVAMGKELGSNVEETTTKLGKLVNIFGDKNITGDKLLSIGNAIAFLANKGVASGEFLADFSNRLAGLAGIAPITLGQTLGLGAGFEELGQSSEVASTAVNQLVLKIGQDVPKYAALAGKSAEEFANTINTSPVEALIQLSEGLSKNRGGFAEIAVAFAEAEARGARVTQTLGVLGKNADFFREKIGQGSEALTRQNDILDAYNVKNQTAGAALDRFKKNIIDLTASTEFQSFLYQAIEGLSKFIQVLVALPKFISDNRTELIALGLAYLTLNRTLTASILTQIQASTAYELLTSATKRQAVATQILGNVQKALPLLLVIATVYAAVKAFQSLNSEMSVSEQVSKKVADAKQEVNTQAAAEIVKMQQAINVLKSETASREEKRKAIDLLNSQYPDYLGNINLEKASVSELTALQDRLTQSIIRTQAARLKQQATDEIATKIIQTELRIADLQKGGDVTAGEAYGADAFSVEGIRTSVIGKLKEEAKGLNGQLIETAKQFDEVFGLGEKTQDAREKFESERDDRSLKAVEARKAVSEKETKEDEKRRNKAAQAIKKEEDERLRDEKAAAENIFRIRQQLINSTFEGQKLAAIAERNEQVKALKGSTEQVAEQKKLLDELLQKRLETINDGYQAERDAALRDIAAKRQEFLLRQANNTVSNIQSSGRAQNRVFDLDAINTEGVFTGKEQQILQTTKTEKEKTELLKKLGIEREKALIEIEERKFQYNKDLASLELAAQKLALDEKKVNDLANLDETERESRAKLDESLRAKLLTVEEYNTALDELTAQTEAERAQIEIENSDAYSELAAQTAIDVLATETDIANQKLQIAKDTNEQILENAKKTKDNEQAIQAARLDFLSTFVNGAKDLLGQDENTRKKYSGVIKALALAEIAINLQRELSAIAVAAAANPTNAVTFGAAGITQYTIQSGIAILRAAFGTAKVLTAKYEDGGVVAEHGNGQVQGGSIPSESGVIRGRSHAQGGVKLGNLEFEGDEYKLRNGNETYIINKNATRQHRSTLDTLAKILRPSAFSSMRKAMASAINAQSGGVRFADNANNPTSRKFAQGGVLTDSGVFNTPLIGAPLPVQSSNVVVVNNSNQTVGELTELIYETQNMILAVNNRIDRITVINKPEEVYNEAIKQREIRVTQNL